MSESRSSPPPPPAPGAPAAPAKPAAPAAQVQTAPAAANIPLPPIPLGSRLYEVMWVVDASGGRDNLPKVLASLKDLAEKSGASWINGDRWDERRLAYPIRKRKRGLYVISHLVCPTANITRLARNAQISEFVLRYLLTVDVDGLSLTPPSRGPDDDEEGGPGERSFFGSERRERRFERRDRERGDRERGDRGERERRREGGPREASKAPAGEASKPGAAETPKREATKGERPKGEKTP